MSPAAFFLAFSGVLLVLALVALWQSLRSAFGGGASALGDVEAGLPERAALLEEKKTLLRAIRDIAFEREVGKIGDEDFTRLDQAYRRRAKRVLELLDQDLGDYLARADRIVEDAMRGRGKKQKSKRKKKVECPECGAENDEGAETCAECDAPMAPLTCDSCGVSNDPDARFCKGCAAPLEEGDDAR